MCLLTLLIEVERRGLHLGLGHSSMFVFCMRALRLSEHAAYSRITAARAARRFPQILPRLADGALSLSSVGLLAPQLTDETVDDIIDAASGKSTREVERLIAAWDPQPDVPSMLRALPGAAAHNDEAPTNLVFAHSAAEPCGPLAPAAVEQSSAPQPLGPTSAQRTVIAPLSPRRYLLKLTIGQDTHDRLQRVRGLLRHAISTPRCGALLFITDPRAPFRSLRSSTCISQFSTQVGRGYRSRPAAVKSSTGSRMASGIAVRDGSRAMFQSSRRQLKSSCFCDTSDASLVCKACPKLSCLLPEDHPRNLPKAWIVNKSMKTLTALVFAALVFAPAAISAQAAASLTGNWNATFTRTAPTGETQSITFTFHFTQKGKELTGTIGPEPARQWKVEKGIVDGTKVTFQVQQPDGPLRSFTLTHAKGRLQGAQKLEFNGQTADVTVEAERAK